MSEGIFLGQSLRQLIFGLCLFLASVANGTNVNDICLHYVLSPQPSHGELKTTSAEVNQLQLSEYNKVQLNAYFEKLALLKLKTRRLLEQLDENILDSTRPTMQQHKKMALELRRQINDKIEPRLNQILQMREHYPLKDIHSVVMGSLHPMLQSVRNRLGQVMAKGSVTNFTMPNMPEQFRDLLHPISAPDSFYEAHLEALESGPLSVEQMIQLGIIEYGTQPLPGLDSFIELKLVQPGISLLVFKTRKLNPQLVQNTFKQSTIYMTGSGTDGATPITLRPIAETYSSLKQGVRDYLGDHMTGPSSKEFGYRSFSAIMTIPGNPFMGRFAKPEYLSAKGNRYALRIAQLVLQNYLRDLYQWDRPTSIVGRSKGGSLALYYGQKYGREHGVASIVAISPQPVDTVNNMLSLKLHSPGGEASKNLEVGGRKVNVDPVSLHLGIITSDEISLDKKFKVPTLVRADMSWDPQTGAQGDPSNLLSTYEYGFLKPIESDPMVTIQRFTQADRENFGLSIGHDWYQRADADPNERMKVILKDYLPKIVAGYKDRKDLTESKRQALIDHEVQELNKTLEIRSQIYPWVIKKEVEFFTKALEDYDSALKQ